jgi:dihydropteroate synthase
VRVLPDLGRCRVMGVLNVTPDSFSDGGRYLDHAAAVRHGLRLVADGADLVDVGGESTRPGADRVDAATECNRVVPVVEELAAAGAVVSVDTMRAETARAAVDAGAVVVNDVSGGLADPALPAFVASAGVDYVVMHWRGHSDRMQQRAVYDDVVGEVRDELARRLDAVTAAGIDPAALAADPGLGFAKTADHNWTLLAHLDELAPGVPLVVGASRKAFLGELLARDGRPRPPEGREAATAAVTAIAAAAGAWAVRVHDVAASADAVRVVAATAAVR